MDSTPVDGGSEPTMRDVVAGAELNPRQEGSSEGGAFKVYSEFEGLQQTRLLESRDRLETMVEDLRAMALTSPGPNADGVPRGDATIEADVAQRRFEAINEALARIDAGRYLQCDACESPIAPERLQALPTTRACRRCA